MKRFIDIFVSLAVLFCLSPLLILIAILILFKLGSPVFFRHDRPGFKGKSFEMIKFRTMKEVFDCDGRPLGDDERLTSTGAILRACSLDELPEFWNVLKGDMSLVGPRPLLIEYLPLYSAEQARRHDIRPGITGWAQVNGRNAISWDDRFKYDVWYVDNQSLLLDFKILLLTIKKVFNREGISQEGHATMPAFTGPIDGASD